MSWRAAGVVALGLVLLCRSTAAHAEAANAQTGSGEAPQESAANLDEPVVRVGSEVIRWRDLEPPPESKNVRRGYQMKAAFQLVVEKSRIAFCRQADCTPDPKDVADWEHFFQTAIDGVGQRAGNPVTPAQLDAGAKMRLELALGGPPARWQANKALYERYGGRVTTGNLGYYEPVEACLRLLHDMEGRGEVEFYDARARADVMESFQKVLASSMEIDDAWRQQQAKEDPWDRQMQHPWNRPFWRMPTKEEMQQKLDALQTKQ